MRLHPMVRDGVLLGVALSVGWWMRGAGTPVLAQHSSSSSSRGSDSDGNLAFQISGIGQEAALTVYNTDNHTLYVYPRVTQGNSHINCAFSLTVKNPGAPVERQNCPIGSQVP